ncbi:diketogulonate reductase-like aldo/keto reductase [Enterococcus sp. PF1-24]|uniref:aldo/keto reductase n=1 Tax=unclassified Enterococcus TaxID=2608891 RepID=UPI0024738893|nr:MULTISPECIES: aldo/keto reductase [unclassified Enterococcus]MDH6364115.1 diketogulonate reductase-like aldo/keto reductase [Enterococcus sp. PFB1-1]MDH6401216.1 diketogulonate reductase-like aldo/keto reductase [Enterococcus sp. PF1-24]
MKKVKLGNQLVNPIGLGTWHMGDSVATEKQEIAALQRGIELGATVIDTAEMYGEGNSEILVGKAIQAFNRKDLYLISKVYPWNASKTQLPISLEQTLQRLQTDYLDLYLLHWPGEIPLSETITAMEQAKAAGKIKAWGVSNFDVSAMQALFSLPNGENCQTNEVLYNLATRGIEFDLQPWQQQNHLPLIAYSPIAQGDTLGDELLQQPSLKKLAKKYQISIFQLLLAWSIRDGQTIAIPQSGNPQHVEENIKAQEIMLTAEDFAEIDKIFPKPNKKVPLAVL